MARALSGRAGAATAWRSSRVSRAASASMAGRSNRSAAYSKAALIPAGAPPAPRSWPERQGQVELGGPGRDRLGPDPQPGQLPAGRADVLIGEHHLEQRMPGRRPGRVQHLHQPLERDILAGLRRQHRLPDPPHQPGETRIAGHVSPQHQRVHEKPDQAIQRLIGPARRRRADRDIRPGTQPGQHRGQPRQHHHEHRRPALPRQRGQPGVQPRARQLPPHHPAPLRRLRRPRPVRRQHQLLRQPRQLLPPVPHLTGQHPPPSPSATSPPAPPAPPSSSRCHRV